MNSNIKTCYIVGAGECGSLSFEPNDQDIVIAADGGYDYLIESGILPDVAIGDFDSLGYVPETVKIIKLPCVKDETDTAYALKYAYDLGYRQYVLFGCLGNAIDHTIANLQIIAQMAKIGAHCVLSGVNECVAAVSNGRALFNKLCSGRISVFAFGGECKGVNISRLKYELQGAKLSSDFPLGVSNEFLSGLSGEISVDNGTLLLIWQGAFTDIDFC